VRSELEVWNWIDTVVVGLPERTSRKPADLSLRLVGVQIPQRMDVRRVSLRARALNWSSRSTVVNLESEGSFCGSKVADGMPANRGAASMRVKGSGEKGNRRRSSL